MHRQICRTGTVLLYLLQYRYPPYLSLHLHWSLILICDLNYSIRIRGREKIWGSMVVSSHVHISSLFIWRCEDRVLPPHTFFFFSFSAYVIPGQNACWGFQYLWACAGRNTPSRDGPSARAARRRSPRVTCAWPPWSSRPSSTASRPTGSTAAASSAGTGLRSAYFVPSFRYWDPLFQ